MTLRRGIFSGIGRIAGRKIAYVMWPDGSISDYTLSGFRRTFGVSAMRLLMHAVVMEIPR